MSAQERTFPANWTLDRRTAAVWGLLAGLSAMAVLPYLMQLQPELFAKLPVPLPAFFVLQGVQMMLLVGVLTLCGLRMGRHIGLGSPLMQAWLGRTAAPEASVLRPVQAICLGTLVGAVLIATSRWLDPLLPEPLHAIAEPGAGQTAVNGVLASFYGGIAEELLARLFVMTLIVWLFSAFGRRKPRPAMFWTAIMLAALLFGAGHLPPAAELWGWSAIVVFRTLLLNAVAATVFGWLYWRRGIEMAMLSHFSADILVHVLAPLAASGSS